MSSNKKLLQGASGFLNLSGPLNVEDVFSTFVYTGTGSAQTITNGIDLSGEGGLVWIKDRDVAYWHQLADTERGVNKMLSTNSTNDEASRTQHLTAFTSTGFTVGTDNDVNYSGSDLVSWTFRKAPNFFDVVTWTGDGTTGRSISHSLGQAPGMIIAKKRSGASQWSVLHRSIAISGSPAEGLGRLNLTNAFNGYSTGFNGEFPSSTAFKVSHISDASSSTLNTDGETYVAYLFGHDTSDEGLIQCGSYTGNGSTSSGPHIDLGFEPQWLFVKSTAASTNWSISDMVRGFHHGNQINLLYPHLNNAEASISTTPSQAAPTSTGFQIQASGTNFNTNGTTYIYMAIRKGPMATPTARSDVFHLEAKSSGGTQTFTTGFPVDFIMNPVRSTSGTATDNFPFVSRLQGGTEALAVYMSTRDNTVENAGSSFGWALDHNNKYIMKDVWSTANIGYAWRRAPKFFDVVAYTGDDVNGRTVSHNLGVAPEMMIIKGRTVAQSWRVYHSALGQGKGVNLDSSDGEGNNVYYLNNTAPTSTLITLGQDDSTNGGYSTKYNYVAYLFATLAGISKVGTFSHTNGSSTDVDCGFSSGSSFVLVKRTDASGDWYVWDSARGIVSGNDPYLTMNSNAIEVTTTDYIDPLNSGFQIASGFTTGTYIFYAIAS